MVRLETVEIPNGDGTLAGLRYLPDRSPRQVGLVLAHGFTSGKYSMDGLASYLTGKSYECLTFDFTGHKLGASGGEMRSTAQIVTDLRSALHWLRQHSDVQSFVLIGHSMGGAACLALAAEIQREERTPKSKPLMGVACLCIGTDPAAGFRSPLGKAMLAQRGDYVAGAPASELLGGLDSLVLSARELHGLPALFLAARQDVLIGPERVEALVTLAQQGGSPPDTLTFQVIEASHLEGPDKAKATVLQWLERLAYPQPLPEGKGQRHSTP